MAQLGPRILLYNADRPEKSLDELVDLLDHEEPTGQLRGARSAVAGLLGGLYATHPPGSVPSRTIAFSREMKRSVALWGRVLAALRANVEDGQAMVEHPERVLGMLKNIAIGSALVHGRRAVNAYDLAQVGHIALSSGVGGRQRVLRALLAAGGAATTAHIERLAGMSTPTALKYMKELAAVGLATFTESQGTTPTRIELLSEYGDLCGAPLPAHPETRDAASQEPKPDSVKPNGVRGSVNPEGVE
jgi:hypothetical protein